MSDQSPYTDDEVADAATTALLRMLASKGLTREVFSDMKPEDRADVLAAQARNNRRK